MVHLLSPGDSCCGFPCSPVFGDPTSLVASHASMSQLNGTASSYTPAGAAGATFGEIDVVTQGNLTSASMISSGDITSPGNPPYDGVFIIPVSPNDAQAVQYKLTIDWIYPNGPGGDQVGCQFGLGELRRGVGGENRLRINPFAPFFLVQSLGFIDSFSGQVIGQHSTRRLENSTGTSQLDTLSPPFTGFSGSLTLIVTHEPNGNVVAQGEVNGVRSSKSFVLATKPPNHRWCGWTFVANSFENGPGNPCTITIRDYEHSRTPNL